MCVARPPTGVAGTPLGRTATDTHAHPPVWNYRSIQPERQGRLQHGQPQGLVPDVHNAEVGAFQHCKAQARSEAPPSPRTASITAPYLPSRAPAVDTVSIAQKPARRETLSNCSLSVYAHANGMTLHRRQPLMPRAAVGRLSLGWVAPDELRPRDRRNRSVNAEISLTGVTCRTKSKTLPALRHRQGLIARTAGHVGTNMRAHEPVNGIMLP